MFKRMKKPNNFCQKCPRKLNRPPNEACPLGLEHASSFATEGKRKRDLEEVGCPWGITSAAHNYCFWNYVHSVSDEDGRMEPLPDAEICALLGITKATLENTLASALKKLKAVKDTPELQDFREYLIGRINVDTMDDTVYLPDSFKVEAPLESVDEELPEDLLVQEKPKRRNNSMPLHRSGKRTDLYGLYSKKGVDKKNGK
jgi:hypothetical protein